MAPKGGRGGGGRGGGSSVSSCPDAFSTTIEQVFFADDVLFLVAYLLLAFALFSMRKKVGAGKKLIGIPFALSIFFFVLTYLLSVISQILLQCGQTDSYGIYEWQIPLVIFSYLANWLFLFVIVYSLNAILREHLGQFPAIFKMACLAVSGLMGVLTLGLLGLVAYNRWTQTEAGEEAGATLLLTAEAQYRVAYWVLYMLSVLAAGALAMMTVFQLRSRRDRGGDLIGWVAALFFVTLLWVILAIVFSATALQEERLTFITQAVLSYLSNFFGVLSFVFLLCIAKHSCWGNRSVVESNVLPDPHAPKTEQQYAYNAQANGQQHAYNAQANGQQYAYNGHHNNTTTGQPYYYQQAHGNNAPEVVR